MRKIIYYHELEREKPILMLYKLERSQEEDHRMDLPSQRRRICRVLIVEEPIHQSKLHRSN